MQCKNRSYWVKNRGNLAKDGHYENAHYDKQLFKTRSAVFLSFLDNFFKRVRLMQRLFKTLNQILNGR